LEEHDAEGLAVQRRRAEHVGAAQPARHLVVVEPPQPFDTLVVPPSLLEALGLGAVPADPQADVRWQHGEGLEENRESLAWLVATDEEDRRPRGGPRCRLGEALD